MHVTTDALLLNQTLSFIENTAFDNETYGNYSEIQSKAKGSVIWWVKLEGYKHIYWAIVLAICLFGVTGNLLVFVMMVDKKLRFLSYSVYLKFLAVSDSCLLIARLVNETEKTLLKGFLDDPNSCIVSFIIRFYVMFLSPWLVVGLTFDRYICVCFPLTRDTICTRRKAIAICSAMTVVAVGLILPFPFGTVVIKGECVSTEGVKLYFIVFRLLLCTFLPCLLILVLNIILTARIRRSLTFRSTFRRPTSDSTNRSQDNATRPLVIVSVMAFVTMLPVGVSEAVKSYLLLVKGTREQRVINSNIWSGLLLIYLLNFGQNFYILIASSATYRQIIRKRLRCYSLEKKQANRSNHVTVSSIHVSVTGPGVELTSFTDVSATPGEIDKDNNLSVCDVIA